MDHFVILNLLRFLLHGFLTLTLYLTGSHFHLLKKQAHLIPFENCEFFRSILISFSYFQKSFLLVFYCLLFLRLICSIFLLRGQKLDDKICALFFAGWNTLSFLWGVFKGRRANCSDSSKSVCIPDASMVHLEREKSTDVPQPVENESAACHSSCNVVVTSAVEKTCISTERVSDSKVSSFGKTYVGIKAKLEEQDGNIDNKYLSRIATNSIKVHPDMKSTSPLVMCSSVNLYYLNNVKFLLL